MSMSETPDIPEKNWTNPFAPDTFLNQLYGKVVKENRDVVIIVSDKRGRRGTSKTTTSLQLASMMDRTEEGLTWDKCTLSAQQLRNAYASQPPGSGLVLDEAEVSAGNRDAMTITNKALREVMSMARVEQKYLVVNAPLKGFIDKDILKLADVWIAMERRGRGLVHHLKWEPYREQLYTEKKQRIELKDIPKGTQLRDIYNKLTREKRKRIGGDEGQKFVPLEEHKKKLQKAREAARKEMRDECVTSFLQHPEIAETNVSQRMVGEAIGVSQSTIHNILNEK